MNERLLDRLLHALIAEWGTDRVQAAIHRIGEAADPSNEQHSRSARSPAKKLSAVELAARTKTQPHRRSLFIALARRFEEKVYLPTIGDVRDFFQMRGLEWAGSTSRAESFRKILDVLAEVSDEELERLVASSADGGSLRLGPLSDAIGIASGAIRARLAASSEATGDKPPPKIKPEP